MPKTRLDDPSRRVFLTLAMTIFLLPGMGATSEMYPGPWRELPESCPLEWPRHFKGESLTDLAQLLIREHDFQPNDVIIGSSLGGMVAGEISNLIGLRQLVLIGSATHPREIPALYQLLHPLIRITPLRLLQSLAAKIPHPLPQMFAESSPDFIRHTTLALFRWEGLQSKENLFRIHGSADLLIPHPQKADLTLPGGHLIASTQAEKCCQVIKGLL